MKFLLAFLCLIVTLSQPAVAGDAEDIRATNARWTEAMKAKDMAAVEQIVGPEFALTWGAATASESVPRAAWMANFGTMTISEYRSTSSTSNWTVRPRSRRSRAIGR